MTSKQLPIVGLTLTRILVDGEERPGRDPGVCGEEVTFETSCGRVFRMMHIQECCENVTLEDINGDLNDLLCSTILNATEETQEHPGYGCGLWTFYRISTYKGTVVMRWLGESNGYYSVSVNFDEITE